MKYLWLLLLAATVAACKYDNYCVGNCGGSGDGDGGIHDAAIDGNDGRGVAPDACIPTGVEICNGVDDDCNGQIDDNAAQVGDSCGSNVGDCTVGTYACTNGQLVCSGNPPTAETCDSHDNDCDGVVDNGNPGGGENCGLDQGECHPGITSCINGQIQCAGQIGTPTAETCDGLDNDCDGNYDEDVPTQGPCGYPNVGACVPGTLTCVGGSFVCVGGQGPTFEQCDAAGVDSDCDGNDHNGYDTNTDIHNCGVCEHSCIGTIPHATAACVNGQCVPDTCDPDYHDDPNVPGPDCDYFCQFAGPNEACNGQDDDCDGLVDENPAPPANFCNNTGACAGTQPSCGGLGGWDCVYGGNVSTDSNGDIVPESTCDNIDNDCNGIVDDPFAAQKGQDCTGAGAGVCQDKGHYQCQNNVLACHIDQPGGTATTETCNGLDDNCDGVVDNGHATGALTRWVSIGGGRSIMQYEATEPAGATYACDEPTTSPWTMVTAPQAELACEGIGARLCTEQEWNRACSQVTGTTWPFNEPNAVAKVCSGDQLTSCTVTADCAAVGGTCGVNTGYMYFEAEDYDSKATATTPADSVTRAWVPDYTAGYSGVSALIASPNTGGIVAIANANAQAPRLDYLINFAVTGNHYVWVHMYRNSGSDDGVHIGMNTSLAAPTATRTVTASGSLAWQWRVSGSFNVSAAGNRYVSLWMDNDGVKVDAIVIQRVNNVTPTQSTSNGGDFSYDANPDTYVGTTCNGHDYSAADDNILTTGTATHCNTPWAGGGVFDLSGNVKEWTAPRLPGENPIRGGASNNIQGGLTCSNAFSVGDDSFFFDNVGFRCCK